MGRAAGIVDQSVHYRNLQKIRRVAEQGVLVLLLTVMEHATAGADHGLIGDPVGNAQARRKRLVIGVHEAGWQVVE